MTPWKLYKDGFQVAQTKELVDVIILARTYGVSHKVRIEYRFYDYHTVGCKNTAKLPTDLAAAVGIVKDKVGKYLAEKGVEHLI